MPDSRRVGLSSSRRGKREDEHPPQGRDGTARLRLFERADGGAHSIFADAKLLVYRTAVLPFVFASYRSSPIGPSDRTGDPKIAEANREVSPDGR